VGHVSPSREAACAVEKEQSGSGDGRSQMRVESAKDLSMYKAAYRLAMDIFERTEGSGAQLPLPHRA